MKVIGKGAAGEFIVSVTQAEIEKVFDKYAGKMEILQVGTEYDLGKGFDFRRDIQRLCREMIEANKAFDAARTTMLSFADMTMKNTEKISSNSCDTKKGWMNCYADNQNIVYSSKEIADRHAMSGRLSCVEVTWRE